MSSEKKYENNIFNIIFIISTIILAIIVPKIFKLNRISFIIGFIISILLINFLVVFSRIYYEDNSWYTEQYQINNTFIYKEAFKDIYKDIKESFKNGFLSICNSTNEYIFRPIGNGIKSILPKTNKKI